MDHDLISLVYHGLRGMRDHLLNAGERFGLVRYQHISSPARLGEVFLHGGVLGVVVTNGTHMIAADDGCDEGIEALSVGHDALSPG
jgi:hypothetical protein